MMLVELGCGRRMAHPAVCVCPAGEWLEMRAESRNAWEAAMPGMLPRAETIAGRP